MHIRNAGLVGRGVVQRRCERYFAMHDDARVFLPWDSEFTDFYKYEPRYDGEG